MFQTINPENEGIEEGGVKDEDVNIHWNAQKGKCGQNVAKYKAWDSKSEIVLWSQNWEKWLHF